MKALTVILALTIGNFLYQYFFAAPPNYAVAFERSFFQAVAIAIFVGSMSN